MSELMAAPVERTIDSHPYRRDPRPRRAKSESQPAPAALPRPLIPPATEDEAHTLDIEA
jgi:hypothetical protein